MTAWPPAECPTCAAPDPTNDLVRTDGKPGHGPGWWCGGHLPTPRINADGSLRHHCQERAGAKTKTATDPGHLGYGRCRRHGGTNPSGRKSAERARIAAVEADLEASLTELGYDQITDPYAVMLDLASRAKAVEEWLAGIVGRLGQDLGSIDAKGTEQVRTQMALFERAMDRAFKFVEAIARLDIDERRVRIAEVQTVLLARALDAALRAPAAGLTPTQIDVVGDALHEALAELEPAPT